MATVDESREVAENEGLDWEQVERAVEEIVFLIRDRSILQESSPSLKAKFRLLGNLAESILDEVESSLKEE